MTETFETLDQLIADAVESFRDWAADHPGEPPGREIVETADGTTPDHSQHLIQLALDNQKLRPEHWTYPISKAIWDIVYNTLWAEWNKISAEENPV